MATAKKTLIQKGKAEAAPQTKAAPQGKPPKRETKHWCAVCFDSSPTHRLAHKTARIRSGIDPVVSHPQTMWFCDKCVSSPYAKKNFVPLKSLEGLREEPKETKVAKEAVAQYFAAKEKRAKEKSKKKVVKKKKKVETDL